MRPDPSKPALWATLTLLLLFAAANAGFLAGNRFIPFDSLGLTFPQVVFTVHSLLHGDAPWWNPLIYGGLPMLGDPESMIFTPHVLVGLLTGEGFGQYQYDLTTLACELAGGAALLAYGLRAGGSPAFSLLGAIVFVFGGVATSRLQHVNEIASYGMLPVILLAVQFLCVRPSFPRGCLLAAATALFLLNPNQVVYLAIFALLPFAVLHMAQSPQPKRAFMWGAAAALSAVLAALPQLAAIHETLAFSTRHALTLADSGPASFPAFTYFSLILPGLFGTLSLPAVGWPPTDLTEDYLYLGIVPAFALLFAVFHLRSLRAAPRLALAMLTLFAFYGLGTHAAFYPWLFRHLPGVAAFRRPADAAFLVNALAAIAIACIGTRLRYRFSIFGTAVLAGLAVLALYEWPVLSADARAQNQAMALAHVDHSFIVRAAVSAALATFCLVSAGYLRGLGRQTLATFAVALPLAAWTTFDLSTAGRNTCYTVPIAALGAWPGYRHPMLAAHQQGEFARLLHAVDGAFPGQLQSGRIEAVGELLSNSAPELFGLASTGGDNPVKIASYAQVFGAQLLQNDVKVFTPAAPSYFSAPYRWIGLRYVLLSDYIVNHPADFGAYGKTVTELRQSLSAGPGAQLKTIAGGYDVWELGTPYPKAALTAINETGWSATPQAEGSCQITEFRNVRVAAHCSTPHPARLVLAEIMAPGWRACVDGKPAAIEVFAGVLRSVLVPAGQSNTSFIYEPVPFWRGTSCT